MRYAGTIINTYADMLRSNVHVIRSRSQSSQVIALAVRDKIGPFLHIIHLSVDRAESELK